MTNKIFCWTFKEMIAVVCGFITIVTTLVFVGFYFGKDKQAAETSDRDQTRIVQSYITVIEKVEKNGNEVIELRTEVKNIKDSQARMESKLDRIVERNYTRRTGP